MAIPMIICGHPRSGTTMLTRLCNTHPKACVTFEFQSFRRLNVPVVEHLGGLRTDWRRRRIVANSRGRWAKRLASGVFLHRYRRAIHRRREARIGASAVADVLSDLFPHARVVGDKFPAYVFDLDWLTRVPELRTLVIYRDCRDVARSAVRMARSAWKDGTLARQLDTPEKVAARWVHAIEIMERNRERVVTLRYEDFVGDPTSALKTIGECLRIDPGGFDVRRVLDSSVGRYRESLSTGEIDRILQVAGPTMERLGYAQP